MLLFAPHPGAQTRFVSFDGRYALIGGAAGGGKSQCLLYDPFRQITIETKRVSTGEIKVSAGRAILFRRTMPELREVLDRAKRTFTLIDKGVEWKEQEKTFTFSCGYKYMFGQMEEEGDWLKYYGFEFTWVGFDELTTFTEEQFDQMDTRVRSSDPVLSKMLSIRAGTNPVGIGLEWVRRRFVEVAPPNTPVIRRVTVPIIENGVQVRTETVEHKQIFIPARLSDNPSIDQAQYAATLTTKSSATRRALLDGDWYVSQGAWVGDLWDPEVHVCKPFKIPSGWQKYRSIDFGISWPGLTSVGYFAVDPDNNLVCYRSLALCRPTIQNAWDLGMLLRDVEIQAGEWNMERGCSMISGPLDSACWAQGGQVGPTIAESLMEVGILVDKSTKDRHGAADQIRYRLGRRSPHPTLLDEDGKPVMNVPGIRWFDTCWSWVQVGGKRVKVGPIITLPVLPADEKDPDVPDTNANDHDWDQTAYMCMARPISGIEGTPDVYLDIDELEEQRSKRSGAGLQRSGYRGIGRQF